MHEKVSTENPLVPSSHPSARAGSSCGHREQPWVQSRAPGTSGQVWKGQMWSHICHTASSVEPAVLPNMWCQASCAAQRPVHDQLCLLVSGAEPAVLPSVQCRTSCAAQHPAQIQLCHSVPSTEPSVPPASTCTPGAPPLSVGASQASVGQRVMGTPRESHPGDHSQEITARGSHPGLCCVIGILFCPH